MKLSIKTIEEKYWVLADQVVVSGSAFATNLLLARALGLTEYGKFSAIVMVQLFLLSISMAFSSQVYQVVYPSLSVTDKRKLTSGMLSQQLLIAIGFFVLVMVLHNLPFANKLIWFKNSWMLILMASLTTIFYLLQDFLRRVFTTQTMGKYAFFIDVTTNLLQLAALAVAWYLHGLNQVMAWSIIGLSFIPSIIVGVFLLKPGRISLSAIGFSWGVQKDKAGWLMGSSLLQWGSGYFFVIAAGWWIGAAALGALRLAQYLFGLLNLLLQAIENYALPKAAGLKGQSSAYWGILLKKCLLIIVPFLLLFSLFAKQILQIAGGPEYGQYTYVIYGLSILYIIITIGYPVRIAIRSLHLNRDYFIAYILSVLFSISAAPWLLKNWALYGVLTGLLLTQIITVGYWLIILKRKNITLWKSFI